MESDYFFKFEDLQVYQKAINFGEIVNKQVVSFPKIEDYRLSSQFIRAADSIVEHCGRFRQFLCTFYKLS